MDPTKAQPLYDAYEESGYLPFGCSNVPKSEQLLAASGTRQALRYQALDAWSISCKKGDKKILTTANRLLAQLKLGSIEEAEAEARAEPDFMRMDEAVTVPLPPAMATSSAHTTDPKSTTVAPTEPPLTPIPTATATPTPIPNHAHSAAAAPLYMRSLDTLVWASAAGSTSTFVRDGMAGLFKLTTDGGRASYQMRSELAVANLKKVRVAFKGKLLKGSFYVGVLGSHKDWTTSNGKPAITVFSTPGEVATTFDIVPTGTDVSFIIGNGFAGGKCEATVEYVNVAEFAETAPSTTTVTETAAAKK